MEKTMFWFSGLLGIGLIVLQGWLVDLSLSRFWCSGWRHLFLPMKIVLKLGFISRNSSPMPDAGLTCITVALASKYSCELKILSTTCVWTLKGAGVST